jgi:hypothetical protein
MSDQIPEMLKNLYFFREVVSSLVGECPWYLRGWLKRKLRTIEKAIAHHERRHDNEVIDASYRCRVTLDTVGKVVWLDEIRKK